MTRNLVKGASNDGQIIKLGLSDGRRAKFLPSVVGGIFDCLRYECHLGNVGLIAMSVYITYRAIKSNAYFLLYLKHFDEYAALWRRHKNPRNIREKI